MKEPKYLNWSMKWIHFSLGVFFALISGIFDGGSEVHCF
jgi:hypothetical protein